MKSFFGFLLSLAFIISPVLPVKAQTAFDTPQEYMVKKFESEITIEKDTSLTVFEKIEMYFPSEKHGIYRNIPFSYTVRGKTIQAAVNVLSVTDEKGNGYKYSLSKHTGSLQVKIGDPEVTISGTHTYYIKYKVNNVLRRYEDHDELYWNVTGHEWDTNIYEARAFVKSPYAEILETTCFAGVFESTQTNCTHQSKKNEGHFTATKVISMGDDFTIVLRLSKKNTLDFPGVVESKFQDLINNWGYAAAVLPFFVFGYMWISRGRDKKYAGENIYYKPEKEEVITKPLFYREHLPMVYSPIQGLSPSEIGTIVDEKVDMHDIVAEITELARLGYLKIVKLEKDKFIGKDQEYLFVRLKEDASKLNEYQEYLFGKLFEDTFTDEATNILTKWLKKDPKAKEYVQSALDENVTALSSLNRKFYEYLDPFRDLLYKSVTEKRVFDGRPDKVRQKWIFLILLFDGLCLYLTFQFFNATGNVVPLLVAPVSFITSFFFAYAMPRRLAWGYSLYRQIKGLAYYVNVGKWHKEIAEKQLFFAEMLPIAISLGIVDKFAKDMEGLGIRPPSYMSGIPVGSLSHDIHAFESKASSSLVTTPGGSSGSWSGGSGFSGGSSGGGFGGGGGGSW